ncbi:hypothetical protein [Cohnella sp.]|uniref:hypothetical protein n=1 Tax=Cohnella sp. TaxID=1883426 RepID=UPI003704AB4D
MRSKGWIWLAVLVFAAVLVVIGLLENNREVVIRSSLETETLPADGKSVMKVRITVTNPDGTPRGGDELTLVRTEGYGQLKASRIKTNADGEVSFDYYSYREGPFTPIVDNRIAITDISVGKIIGIKKKAFVDIPVVKPSGTDAEGEEDGGKPKPNKNGHIQLGGG